MSANDPLKWISIQNQIRQTELLSDIRRGRMSPSERRADDAANARDWEIFKDTFSLGICGLILCGGLLWGYFTWSNYQYTRDITAEEVSTVISNRLAYLSTRRYGCRARGELLVFTSERPLSDEAIDLIASTDVSFDVHCPISASQLQRLAKKKDGWLIFDQDNDQESKHFRDSEANIWLVKPDPRDLKGWSTHKGKMRLDPRPDTKQVEQLLRQGGKEIETAFY